MKGGVKKQTRNFNSAQPSLGDKKIKTICFIYIIRIAQRMVGLPIRPSSPMTGNISTKQLSFIPPSLLLSSKMKAEIK